MVANRRKLCSQDTELVGTTLLARKLGFLCVISLLSTLRNPFVISAPWLISAKTAAAPPAGAEAAGGAAEGGGGGGGGGGGPAAAAGVLAGLAMYSAIVTPYIPIKKMFKTESH